MEQCPHPGGPTLFRTAERAPGALLWTLHPPGVHCGPRRPPHTTTRRPGDQIVTLIAESSHKPRPRGAPPAASLDKRSPEHEVSEARLPGSDRTTKKELDSRYARSERTVHSA